MKTLKQEQLQAIAGGYAWTVGDLLRGESMPPMGRFPIPVGDYTF